MLFLILSEAFPRKYYAEGFLNYAFDKVIAFSAIGM